MLSFLSTTHIYSSNLPFALYHLIFIEGEIFKKLRGVDVLPGSVEFLAIKSSFFPSIGGGPREPYKYYFHDRLYHLYAFTLTRTLTYKANQKI